MNQADLLNLILGNLGTLVLLSVAIVAIWRGWFVPGRSYSREVDRVDRLDQLSLKALQTTETLVEQQKKALSNHEIIFANQVVMLALSREIRREQEYAKELLSAENRIKERGH